VKRRLAVLDLETDPFEHGRIPSAFLAGLYDGEKFVYFWGDDCIAQIAAYILSYEEPLIIYAHNGGKFDFFYLLEYLHSELRIVNSRIIQARIGEHELRDSFAIMPFPLRDFDKDEIDYQKMSRENRDTNREEILTYFKKDHTALYELVTAFHAEFGDQLTIGGSSLKQLKKHHKFNTGNSVYDAKLRKDFYFGGRNQVFRSGTFDQTCNIYDVNSMYPYVMSTFLHPVGTDIQVSKVIMPNTCFVVAEGFNHGAFPVREKDGSLNFTKQGGRFCTTIHEWNAAEHTGTFRATKIIKTYGFDRRITFAEFVDHYFAKRATAKLSGDKIRTLFYKFVLNSAYGKFAQNPENFSEYQITPFTDILPEPWTPAYIHQSKYVIWSRPSERKFYYNIATGASITGASRALLLHGLHAAIKPVYCDTDSIICESMRNQSVRLDNDALGAWKLEAVGNRAAICGKKLYCIIDTAHDCTCANATKAEPCKRHVKKAHKGARLTGDEIEHIAGGSIIKCENPVPSFKFTGSHKFTVRNIRRTNYDENNRGLYFGGR
jgi:hypothetical protein